MKVLFRKPLTITHLRLSNHDRFNPAGFSSQAATSVVIYTESDRIYKVTEFILIKLKSKRREVK